MIHGIIENRKSNSANYAMPRKTITFSPTQDSITMNLNLMIDEFGTESSGSYLAPRADVEAIYKYRYGVILESISEESTMGN